jgi:radical SAM-linked protein
MPRDKVRIRFRKYRDLRLISHHDLMRCFERMLRRAALPFHSTEGFNPKPRMAFALSLALGIEGHEEVVELELDEELPPDEVRERLARQAPAGLEILTVQHIPRSTSAQVRRVCYRVPVPAEQREALDTRIGALLAEEHCWIERSRPEPRRLDIRPWLRDLRLRPEGLEIDLWVTPQGMARPQEFLNLLELGGLLDAGAVLQRITLELTDEGDPGPKLETLNPKSESDSGFRI